MKQLEMIQIRSVVRQTDTLIKELKALIADFMVEYPGISIQLYRHSTISSDLCLQLIFGSDSGLENDIGMVLSDTLKAFGIINRSTWELVSEKP